MNSGSEKKLSMDELLEKNRPAQMVQTYAAASGAGADTASRSASHESGVGGSAEPASTHWGTTPRDRPAI